MPGTVYTVASGKGGVGKTTTTVNLGVALWQEGNAVAIVDADLGMANLAAVLGLEPETTLHDVLAGEAIIEEAVVEAKGGDLLVLPGSRELQGFAAANPQKLKDVLENLAARCDYVIVDTGAGLGYEDVLPLGLADAVILVSSADPASLGDTRKTAELADLIDTPVLGVIVTRAVAGTDSAAIAAEIGAPLLGTIPEDSAVMEATVAGDPLASHAPNADATTAYMELGGAVLEAGSHPPSRPDDDEPTVEEATPEPNEAASETAAASDVPPDEATEEEPEADATGSTAEGTEAPVAEPADPGTSEPGEADTGADPEPAAEEAAEPDEPEPEVDEADEPAPAADATEDAEAAEPGDDAEAAEPEDDAEAAEPEDDAEAAEPEDDAEAAEPEDDAEAAEPEDDAEAAEPEDAEEAEAAADEETEPDDVEESEADDDGAEDDSDDSSGGWLSWLFS